MRTPERDPIEYMQRTGLIVVVRIGAFRLGARYRLAQDADPEAALSVALAVIGAMVARVIGRRRKERCIPLLGSNFATLLRKAIGTRPLWHGAEEAIRTAWPRRCPLPPVYLRTEMPAGRARLT